MGKKGCIETACLAFIWAVSLAPFHAGLTASPARSALPGAVLSEALADAPTGTKCDINGDGRVDVLDLQQLLAERQGIRSGEELPPARAEVESALSGRIGPQRLELPAVKTADTVAIQPLVGGLTYARLMIFPAPKMERYLFDLTPHAPPVSGAFLTV